MEILKIFSGSLVFLIADLMIYSNSSGSFPFENIFRSVVPEILVSLIFCSIS
jgi:hypothetical protein